MRYLSRRHYREQLALCTAELIKRNEQLAKTKADLASSRETYLKAYDALKRIRRERDELRRPIEQAQNRLLIVAPTEFHGRQYAAENGLTYDKYRLITSPHQLRGYQNRRYVVVSWPNNGNKYWPEILEQLEILKAVGGFLEIDGTQ